LNKAYSSKFHPSERDAVKELYPHAHVHTFKGTGHLPMIK
ncbi:unnamed protein product, partial [marine sediment metagenome]